MSLARAHQARVLASMGGRVLASTGVAPARAAAAANDAGGRPSDAAPIVAEGRAYQQLLAALGQDERRLKCIQSVASKVAAKRSMLPAYRPWVEGRLAGDVGAQDAIVATMLVWSLDVGEWELGLQLAAHTLRHSLALPARFKRTPAAAIAEMIADAACAAHDRQEDFPAEVLLRTGALTAEQDMPDEVRARLHKAVGQQAARLADDPAGAVQAAQHRTAALVHLRRARELDGRCGVAALIKRLERDQAKEASAAG